MKSLTWLTEGCTSTTGRGNVLAQCVKQPDERWAYTVAWVYGPGREYIHAHGTASTLQAAQDSCEAAMRHLDRFGRLTTTGPAIVEVRR